MGNDIFKKLADKYPFITLCICANEEYVGIVQNKDDAVTTIYDFALVESQETRLLFLELANIWWFESNRSVPINIFLKHEWHPFRYTLRTFSNKDFEILHGPACCLMDIARKKSKRKSITLVRRLG